MYIGSLKAMTCVVVLLLCFHYGFIMRTCDKFLNTSTLCFCVTFCSLVCENQTRGRITRSFLVERSIIPCFTSLLSDSCVATSDRFRQKHERSVKVVHKIIHSLIYVNIYGRIQSNIEPRSSRSNNLQHHDIL